MLLAGFGAKGVLMPLVARRLIWSIDNCDVYYLDYTEPFICLRKILVRMILHVIALIIERVFNKNHREFRPLFNAMID